MPEACGRPDGDAHFLLHGRCVLGTTAGKYHMFAHRLRFRRVAGIVPANGHRLGQDYGQSSGRAVSADSGADW